MCLCRYPGNKPEPDDKHPDTVSYTHLDVYKRQVLYNPDDDMCIWQKLTKDTIERTNNGKGAGFFVKVPLSQIFLDDSSNEKLLTFTNLPEHITNYNFLLSQKKFMQIIQNGGQIKLHSMEWIHKSSGRGNTELRCV